MPNGEIFQPTRTIIADRIGPIFDPAFLKLIPKDKLKEIMLVQLQVQEKRIQDELSAVKRITEMVKELRF